jgi:hypothetical protein
MNERSSEGGVFVVIALVAVSAVLVVLWVAHGVGADAATTGSALFGSLLWIAVCGAAGWGLLRLGWLELWGVPAVPLPFVWPCWWKVLDSVALGGADPDSPFSDVLLASMSGIRVNSPLLKWVGELMFVALVVVCIWSARQRR